MKTDQNEIELNDEDRQLLLGAEAKFGKPWRVILREKLGNAVGVNGEKPPSRDDSERRQKNWSEFLDEMRALPIESADDGFSNRDHDKLLYGGK